MPPPKRLCGGGVINRAVAHRDLASKIRCVAEGNAPLCLRVLLLEQRWMAGGAVQPLLGRVNASVVRLGLPWRMAAASGGDLEAKRDCSLRPMRTHRVETARAAAEATATEMVAATARHRSGDSDCTVGPNVCSQSWPSPC